MRLVLRASLTLRFCEQQWTCESVDDLSFFLTQSMMKMMMKMMMMIWQCVGSVDWPVLERVMCTSESPQHLIALISAVMTMTNKKYLSGDCEYVIISYAFSVD